MALILANIKLKLSNKPEDSTAQIYIQLFATNCFDEANLHQWLSLILQLFPKPGNFIMGNNYLFV